MKKLKIYCAGAISGHKEFLKNYKFIIKTVEEKGHIPLCEFAIDSRVKTKEEVFKRDIDWLLSSDALIAECSAPSTGTGYEIATANLNNIKTLCVYYKNSPFKLSLMISGNPVNTVKTYENFDELKKIVSDFLDSLNAS